ncbi:MAG: SNF2-related protein [bacterium]
MSALSRPDLEFCTPSRVAAVLRRLGAEWAAEVGILDPIPPVVPLSPRDPTEWWVGQTVVSCEDQGPGFPVEGRWACDCTPMVPARCVHVATALVVHAWNIPRTRPLFEQPAWSLALEPLLFHEPEEEPPAPGYLRYRLKPAGPGLLPVERERVRLSRKDGRTLRPGAVPDSLAELEATVATLTEADRAFHLAVETLQVLTRLLPRGPDGQLVRLQDELRNEAMSALLAQPEIFFGETRLRVSPKPLLPTLQVSDDDDGLLLAWAEPVAEVYAIGPGYVITADDVFQPLAAGIAPEVLLAPLPRVPAADAGKFLDQFVRRCGVRLELLSARLPPALVADGVEARVMLAEGDEALQVSLAFGYRRGADTAVVEAGDPRPYLDLSGALLAREPSREAALAARLTQVMGRPAPTLLRDDAALDFLLDGPDALGPDFRLFGDVDLTRHRVAGRLQASVRLPSGQDWFDARVAFEVDGQEVLATQVLASWLAGRRYLRLDDGTLARLPEQWLERHGRATRQIEALRAAHGGRLPGYAVPLLAELPVEDAGPAPWRDLLEKLHDFEGIPEADPPAGFGADLRSYQLAGYRWLRFLRDQGLAGCLADDMGLGKTVQALAVLADTHGAAEGPPSLVVAPTSVVPNWATEAQRFAPGLNVVVHHGPDRGDDLDGADLVITSYALLRLDAARLLGRPWRYAVLDEAQQIKNPHSQVARAARALDARHRLALTGTPLENHLLELWSIFEFLMPGYFGSSGAFQRDFALPIQRDRDLEAARTLRRRLRPFVLRRLKSEVATELPPAGTDAVLRTRPRAAPSTRRVKATCRATVMAKVAEVGLKQGPASRCWRP